MTRDTYITTTTSTCIECRRLLPARIHIADGGVWLHKQCPEHGAQDVRISSSPADYLEEQRFHRAGSMPWQFAASAEKGCPGSCGLCPEHEQHVCMPILEITDHCDLSCPICLVKNRSSFHLTKPEVAAMLDRLIASEEQVDVVNLSGGEPTLNPEFREIVDECLGRKEILRVSVSTNGLRLLQDEDLLRFLAERNVVISLQFDGLRDDAYENLRGRPLLSEKLWLLDLAAKLGAPMSLTVTVAAGVNEGSPAEVLPLLFERDNVLSVMFQPAAYTGGGAGLRRPRDATTIPDVLRAIHGAAKGMVSSKDFCPLPCSHPACFSLGFYLKTDGGKFIPVKGLVEIGRYLDILQSRAIVGADADGFELVKDAVYDLWSGPAALAPDSRKALAAIKRLIESVQSGGYRPKDALAIAERSMKSVFIHAFMDPHTFDLSRARKCCNVYPLPDGRCVPACVHNCLGR